MIYVFNSEYSVWKHMISSIRWSITILLFRILLRLIHRTHFYAHKFSLFLRASTIRIPVFFPHLIWSEHQVYCVKRQMFIFRWMFKFHIIICHGHHKWCVESCRAQGNGYWPCCFDAVEWIDVRNDCLYILVRGAMSREWMYRQRRMAAHRLVRDATTNKLHTLTRSTNKYEQQ